MIFQLFCIDHIFANCLNLIVFAVTLVYFYLGRCFVYLPPAYGVVL